MTRTAVTLSISMPAPTRRLLDDLRGGRSVSEYVRRLVEQDAALRSRAIPTAAEVELEHAQRELPRAWRHRQPDLLERFRAFPSAAELAGTSVVLEGLDGAQLRPAGH